MIVPRHHIVGTRHVGDIPCRGHSADHRTFTKVVDIDKIYQNMQNEQNPMSRFLAKSEKHRKTLILTIKSQKAQN